MGRMDINTLHLLKRSKAVIQMMTALMKTQPSSSMLLELNSLQKDILKLSDDFYSRMSISPDLKKQGGEFES
ncbi:hypothetical protein BASA62_009667 [Batrachochytrium salamandrivorans]|nr:hypothetical protein BASA62_009667 [Batrachochytrium salamandrivorans]